MAVKTYTMTDVSQKGNGAAWKVAWAAATENDTLQAVSLPEYADRSIQVEGTFGGATVQLKGSNDGTNFETLRDPSSTTISFTGAGIKTVLENTILTQPTFSGGTGQSLTVTMLFHLPHPFRT